MTAPAAVVGVRQQRWAYKQYPRQPARFRAAPRDIARLIETGRGGAGGAHGRPWKKSALGS